MKKIVIVGITALCIFLIYWITLDRKIYYLALGDGLSVGLTDTEIIGDNYTNYLKLKIEEKGKLEKYVNQFTEVGTRITDVIYDIDNNAFVELNGKNVTMKNALIKADLVTLSINHDDFLNRLENYRYSQDIYEWIVQLSKDYEKLLLLMREYCKEEIIVLGFYSPKSVEWQESTIQAVDYLNNKFEQISLKYNAKFINISTTFLENESFLDSRYPTKQGYQAIGEYILAEIPEIQ